MTAISKISADSPLEKQARAEDFCRGCDGPKEARAEGGPVVCWTCWRRPDNPFKFFQGTLEEWLEEIHHANGQGECAICDAPLGRDMKCPYGC